MILVKFGSTNKQMMEDRCSISIFKDEVFCGNFDFPTKMLDTPENFYWFMAGWVRQFATTEESFNFLAPGVQKEPTNIPLYGALPVCIDRLFPERGDPGTDKGFNPSLN